MADASLNLIPYLYQGDKLVRAVVGPDRQPWFVAADIARYLGYRDAANALRIVSDDEKATHPLSTLGGVSIVSEAGFYTLAFRSNKPKAIEFRRWITHEVIPSIRRTGGYRFRSERSATAWMKNVTAVRLAIAELRRCYGPQEATRLSVDLWARVDIVIDDPSPLQGELPLDESLSPGSIH